MTDGLDVDQILKHQHELLQLVTDQGFLGEPSVVWETLANIDGDGQFVDGAFRTVPPRAEPSPTLRRPATTASAASASAAHREVVSFFFRPSFCKDSTRKA